MIIHEAFAVKSDCYKSGRKITPKGIILHSVGVAQPSALAFINGWNKPGVAACAHAVVDAAGNVYQLLPWDHRGWHAGGSANDHYIGVEMTEPATIRYTGGANYTDTNPSNTALHVRATYATMLELARKLTSDYGWDVHNANTFLSHSEAHKQGIASNHADVEHLWSRYGLTMADFRLDVAKDEKLPAATQKPPQNVTQPQTNAYGVQVGAFANPNNARRLLQMFGELGVRAVERVDNGIHRVIVYGKQAQ